MLADRNLLRCLAVSITAPLNFFDATADRDRNDAASGCLACTNHPRLCSGLLLRGGGGAGEQACKGRTTARATCDFMVLGNPTSETRLPAPGWPGQALGPALRSSSLRSEYLVPMMQQDMRTTCCTSILRPGCCLTFELSRHQRCDARARMAKMYREPPAGPAGGGWGHAVGARLERGVRRHTRCTQYSGRFRWCASATNKTSASFAR